MSPSEKIGVATFDPGQASFEDLAQYFFQFHDPTLDRHENGGQYRSAIFYHDDAPKATANRLIQQLKASG